MKVKVFVLIEKEEDVLEAGIRIKKMWEKVYGKEPEIIGVNKDISALEEYAKINEYHPVMVITYKRSLNPSISFLSAATLKAFPVQFENTMKLMIAAAEKEKCKPKCFLYEFKSRKRWDQLYASVKKLNGDFYDIYPFTLDLDVAASYFKDAEFIAIPEDQDPPFTSDGKSIKKFKMTEETKNAQNTDDSFKCPLQCTCEYGWKCPQGTIPGSNNCARTLSNTLAYARPIPITPYQSVRDCRCWGCCESDT